MNFMKSYKTGKVSFILIALITGIYLSGTFGSGDPWSQFVDLMKNNTAVKIVVVLTSVHFLFAGIFRFSAGRLKQLPSSLSLLSISMIIGGIFLSVMFRESETVRLSVAEQTKGGMLIEDIHLDIPDTIVLIGENAAMKSVKTGAVIQDKGKQLDLRPYPFSQTSSGYAFINDAGLSPSFEIAYSGEKSKLSKLDLFPPDKKTVTGLHPDLKIEVSFEPEREFEKGRLTAREYNLLRPKYRVVAKREDTVLLDTVVSDHSSAPGRGIFLKSESSEKWVEVVFVRDAAVLLVYAGIVCIIFGVGFLPLELYMKSKKS